MLFFFLSVLNNLYAQFNHEWEPTDINYSLCILADHLSKGHLIHPPASLKEKFKSSPSRHKCNCLVEKKMTFIFLQRDATPISAGWVGIWQVLPGPSHHHDGSFPFPFTVDGKQPAKRIKPIYHHCVMRLCPCLHSSSSSSPSKDLFI